MGERIGWAEGKETAVVQDGLKFNGRFFSLLDLQIGKPAYIKINAIRSEPILLDGLENCERLLGIVAGHGQDGASDRECSSIEQGIVGTFFDQLLEKHFCS